jgi:hypothetical protein
MFVAPHNLIYSSIQGSVVLVIMVPCKLINFVFQMFFLFISEMPTGFVSYTVLVIPTYFAWII